jgi:hypothetical protein
VLPGRRDVKKMLKNASRNRVLESELPVLYTINGTKVLFGGVLACRRRRCRRVRPGGRDALGNKKHVQKHNL